MSRRVLITVTHLLGAGHLTRAAALARAFAENGHETTLVTGGMPVPIAALEGVRLVQLPPVRIVGTDFRSLLDEQGRPVDQARLAQRRERLLEILKAVRPDILITELFPFGRRILADEFMALIDEARRLTPRPLILCSIRDILASPSKPERIEETHERLLRAYDAVLIHGDPQLVPLQSSWPVIERIRPLLYYTGYVDDNPAPVPERARKGIVVSGGSSAASLPLLRAAIETARDVSDRPWHVLVGRGIADEEFRALTDQAPAHVVVERARPDFRTLLSGAELSVSQAGYNTVVDLLRCGVKAVLVPFEAGRETEQRLRAERLKSLALAEIVSEEDLSPQVLAAAIRRGLDSPASPPPRLSLDGAQRSVTIAEGLMPASPASRRGIDWSPLAQALDRATNRDCPIRFWWRDDDAVADTPQLDRLLRLAHRHDARLALAAIPGNLEASLLRRLADEPRVQVLVHGWSHANHAPAGEKKAEFGSHRSLPAMVTDAEQGLLNAKEALGARLLPVFVPPWNRIAPGLVPLLPNLGYRALSTFGDRAAAQPAPGLLQINTHLDPIDWHGTRSAADPEAVIAGLAGAIERRAGGRSDRHEPIGLLTHHLVHDEAIWSFCERLLEYLATRGIRLLPMDQLLREGNRITVGV